MTKKNWCCELACERSAEWEIWWGRTSDDYTHACSEHVGVLLHPGCENVVTKIEAS